MGQRCAVFFGPTLYLLYVLYILYTVHIHILYTYSKLTCVHELFTVHTVCTNMNVHCTVIPVKQTCVILRHTVCCLHDYWVLHIRNAYACLNFRPWKGYFCRAYADMYSTYWLLSVRTFSFILSEIFYRFGCLSDTVDNRETAFSAEIKTDFSVMKVGVLLIYVSYVICTAYISIQAFTNCYRIG